MSLRTAWRRRPSSAVSRLGKRQLLVLSVRDLLRGARATEKLLVAFVAPSYAAMAGIARAARETRAPLMFVRPSGAGDRDLSEARDDSWFVEAGFRAAAELRFEQPVALLKEPPRHATGSPEHVRVHSEIEAGFTGVSLAARVDEAAAARDAALSAAEVCRLDLGLEVIPLGGSAQHALRIAQALAARGSPPSALRITGHESDAQASIAAGLLDAGMHELALTTASEAAPESLVALGVSQLTAAGPFLRSLHESAPPALWDRLQAWADENQASLEQSAAHHQRELREMPEAALEKLEALCFFEATELLAKARARNSGEAIAAHIASIHDAEARL